MKKEFILSDISEKDRLIAAAEDRIKKERAKQQNYIKQKKKLQKTLKRLYG